METRIIIPTIHALKRAYERGISSEMILDTVKHGELTRKQGLKYYVMLRKSLPNNLDPQYAERVTNTTVIVSKSDTIITVYKNKKSFKAIKRKSKHLRQAS